MTGSKGPATQRVFKTYTAKRQFQFVSEYCAKCLAKPVPGAPPLSLCSGCHNVRYCGKEHQIAHWPEHRVMCKTFQADGQIAQLENTSGLISTEEQRYLLNEWMELHRQGIEEALAWAMHDCSPPYDFRKKYALFMLTYRPESNGNPSLAFELEGAALPPVPPAGTPVGEAISAFLPRLLALHEEEKGHDNYISVVPSIFVIDEEILVLKPWSIFENYLNPFRPSSQPFYWVLRSCSRSGLVIRKYQDTRTLGLVSKHASGTKWVWKKHTHDELADKGIHNPWGRCNNKI